MRRRYSRNRTEDRLIAQIDASNRRKRRSLDVILKDQQQKTTKDGEAASPRHIARTGKTN